MHKKDYLQRQFEEFGKVLAVILGLKLNKDWEKFEKEIQDAARKFTSIQIENAEDISESEFEQLISGEHFNQDQKKILATLLFEKLNLYSAKGDAPKYEHLKNRCLKLYLHLQDNFTSNEFDLDVHHKVGVLSKL
jgi:hypothetical protein